MKDAYTKETDSVLLELKTSKDQGLTNHEAEVRLHEYGLNLFLIQEENKASSFKILLEQFQSFFFWILLAAAAVSFVFKIYLAAGALTAITIVNFILNFTQSYQKKVSLEALIKAIPPAVKVIREGQEKEIESRYLVPGDILVLKTGNKVPADARLIEIHDFEAMESALTGESSFITKTLSPVPASALLADRKDMVYCGTIAVKGRAKAVITGTGMKTELGRIAGLVKKSGPGPAPLHQELMLLSRWLGIAAVTAIILALAIGLIREAAALSQSAVQYLLLSVTALAVAAVPVSLSAVVSLSFSLSIKKMLKSNVLVKKISSIKCLGSINVICSSQTGSLTKNEMTVRKIWNSDKIYEVTGDGYGPDGTFALDRQIVPLTSDLKKLLLIGALCNDSRLSGENEQRKVIGDPAEACLIVSAEKAGLKKSDIDKAYPRIDEIPFSEEKKFMTTIHQAHGKKVALAKGAPDSVLPLCDRILINGKILRLSRMKIKEILDFSENFSLEALHVFGFSYKDIKDKDEAEKNMIFIGLQAMIDPPRQETKEAVQKAKEAGIRTILFSGGRQASAVAVAKELGIEGRSVTGQDLEKMADSDLEKEIGIISIYARISPEQKHRVVAALQKKGFQIAMVGSSLSDAPALKQADVGIVQDISRAGLPEGSFGLVLKNNDFSSVTSVIEQGRIGLDSLKKSLVSLLISNSASVMVIFFSVIIGLPLPLIVLQVLWINLFSIGLPAAALSVEPAAAAMLQQPLEKTGRRLIGKIELVWILAVGLIMALGTLGIFTYALLSSGWAWGNHINASSSPHYYLYAATLAFTTLMLFQMFNVINCKRWDASSLRQFFSNSWLVAAIIISVVLQITAVYVPFFNGILNTVPLSVGDWIVSLAVASSVLWLGETYKLIMRKKIQR